MIKSGIVVIVGKTNVGKSSLFNCFFNRKVSIISSKPQTTRWNIKSIYHLENKCTIGLIDTPGIHSSQNLLDDFINKQIKIGIKETEVILGLFDSSSPFDNNDELIVDLINKSQNKKIIICLTKIDLINKKQLNEKTNELKSKIKIQTKFPLFTFSVKNENLKKPILAAIENLLPNINQPFITQEWTNSDDDTMIVREIIRESCIKLLHNEISFGLDIEITEKKYNEKNNTFYIYANIIAEKQSHKKILIGKNGQKIKKIGVCTRNKILKIYDCKIYLNLFVKIRKNWRNNFFYLTNAGYK